MSTILSICSRPSTTSWRPGRWRPWCRTLVARLTRMSVMSDDLPEPETPVTATILPSGTSASMFFRLFSRAPRIQMLLPLPSRRSFGTGIWRRPDRYAPVMLSGQALIASISPSATRWPPWMPAPGPMSITQSAARIIASSCSTMSTVLPRSRSRSSVLIRRSLSIGWSPIDGSSQM